MKTPTSTEKLPTGTVEDTPHEAIEVLIPVVPVETAAVAEPEAVETQEIETIAEKVVEAPETAVEEETKRPDISSTSSWGPSFGTAPPVSFRQVASSPLSSWFLSKGYVNFSKRPEYPKTSIEAEMNTANAKDTSAKSSHSDEFYKELARANWRMWYGHVNPQDVLDPPLSDVKVPQTSEIQEQSVEDEEDTDETTSSSRLESLLKGLKREKKKSKAFDSTLLKILKH